MGLLELHDGVLSSPNTPQPFSVCQLSSGRFEWCAGPGTAVEGLKEQFVIA